MTKYLVKIYNCGKLEDKQILEETDKIQLADYYIQDNQLWGEVWAETDEEELYYEKVIICLKVKAELGLNEETVADMIRHNEDETVIEDYLDLDLIDFEVTNVEGHAVEDVLTPAQIQAVEKSIAESIELDYMNDEAGVKIVIRDYERSKRRGIPKEIASQYPKEIVEKVKDVVRESGVKYADLLDDQLQLALELASKNADFEDVLYLKDIDESHIATILAAANQGYDIINKLGAKERFVHSELRIELAGAALKTGHVEIIDKLDRFIYEACNDVISTLEDNTYHPVMIDDRVLESQRSISDIHRFIGTGHSPERVIEILDSSSSISDFQSTMVAEELIDFDPVNGKILVDYLQKHSGISTSPFDPWFYYDIMKLMQVDAVDKDKILEIHDDLTHGKAKAITELYNDGYDFFKYVDYDKMTFSIYSPSPTAVGTLLRHNLLKPLDLYVNKEEYNWMRHHPCLIRVVEAGLYEDFMLDDSLTPKESFVIVSAVDGNHDNLEKIRDLFNNRENLDQGLSEAIWELSA